MDEYRMTGRVLRAEVSGGARKFIQPKPKLGWMDGVEVALCGRGMPVEAARNGYEGVQYPRAHVDDRVLTRHFCFVPLFIRTALSCCGGLSSGEGWDAVT